MARGGRGYLLTDERASGGALTEQATLTCGHCNTVVLLRPDRTRDRGHCRRCDAYVCDRPVCRAECNPTAEGIELALAYPDAGVPFIGRAADGAILFDPRLRDRRRPH